MDWLSLGTSLAKIGAPMLASVFLGPEAGPLVGVLVNKLSDALGCPATPEAVQTAITTDPAAAAKVQTVEQTHADTIEAYLQDVQSARAMTVSLAQADSAVKWGAPVMSIANMVIFAGMVGLVASGMLADNATAQLIVGAVLGSYTSTNSFWLGSSRAASQRTDQAIDAAYRAAPKTGLAVRRK